jgi:hypothetical protein
MTADLRAARCYRLAAPWPDKLPDRSDEFFEIMADCCARPDLAARLLEFADAFRTPAEREKRRLTQRDGLIRAVSNEHYPQSLGANVRARLLASDLAEMESARLPPARPQNHLLRQILELNSGAPVGLGFENLKQILRRAG